MAEKKASTEKSNADWWARVPAWAGLLIGSCQLVTSHEALQEQRAAAIKIEADKPSGTVRVPWVLIKATNVTNKPIHDAEVSAALGLLPPDGVANISKLMETKKEDIPPNGFEPQRIHVPIPLTQEQLTSWQNGELVLVGALKVKWKDAGAWTSSYSDRCFAWVGQPTREIACEDLTELSPDEARAHVRNVLAMRMTTEPETASPTAAFTPGNN